MKWKFLTDGDVNSSPAIGADGTVYVGSNDNYLYAIQPDGTLKWKFRTENFVTSSPAIGSDGTVYVGSHDTDLYAITSKGSLKWKFQTVGNVFSSPAISSEGTVYIGSGHFLYAVKSDGTLKWKFQTGDNIWSLPAIGIDGTVYIGSVDDYIYAVESDGSLKWKFQTENCVFSSPAIGIDGTVYIGSIDNYIYAVQSDGSLKWKFQTGADINSSPAIDIDGTVYVGSADGYLYAFAPETSGAGTITLISPNGGETWQSGTTQNITWTSSNVDSVRIDYSTDSGSSWNEIVSSTSAAPGSYEWTIPTSINSTKCLIRITSVGDSSVNDTSNAVFTISPSSPPVTLANTAWPMRGQNPRHTGRGTATVAASSTVKWKFKTDGSVESSPAIGIDGTVYVGSNDMYLYAIQSDGTLKWKFQTGGQIFSSPAIGSDGTVYVGSIDTYLYAVKSDGTLKWKFRTDDIVFSSPAIGSDGTVYVGSSTYLFAVTSDGTLKWKFQTGGSIQSSPAIDSDGTVYVGSNDDYLYAINSNGTLKWKFQTENYVYSSPAIGSTGTVYVGSNDTYLYAVKSDGTFYWKILTRNHVYSSPAIDSDGTVYAGSSDGYLYATTSGVTNKWVFQAEGGFAWSSFAIGSDGTLYVGTSVGYLYAIKSDGTLKWKFQTGDFINSSPAIGADGTLYVGSDDGYLYAFAPETQSRTITVSSPNGGETCQSGTVQNITWTSSNIDNVRIEYSIDSGSSWATIASGTSAASGSYEWAVPATVSSSMCMIRITSVEDSSVNDTSDAVFTIAPSSQQEIVSGSPWPMRGQNPRHTGIGIASVAASSAVKWKYQAGNSISSSPAISIDGTVYVGSYDTYLYAVNSDGTLKWKYQTGDTVSSSPAIDSDGTVYVGSHDMYLYAIQSDGTLKWRYLTGGTVNSSPVIGIDGMVYVGSWDTCLYAIQSDGTLKWKYQTEYLIEWTSPATDTDGTVYVGSWDNYIYAINPDGTLKWRYRTGGAVQSSPAIGSDGTVYVGSNDTYLYALKSDGTLKWRYQTGGVVISSPSTGFDGTVYVGSGDNCLHAVKPDGTLKWKYQTGGTVNSLPSIGTDGTVYVGSVDGYIYAVKPDGTLKWKYQTGGAVYSSPSIGTDGTVYVGSDDGYLYAFAPETVFVTVTSPNGGEIFESGTTHNITWTCMGIDSVKIEYSFDNGSNWSTVTESTDAVKDSYSWTVPDIVSTDCRIRISASGDPGISDVSNNPFEIYMKTTITDTISVYAVPDNATPLPNSDVKIDIIVDMGDNDELLGEYTIGIAWDPEVLDYQSVTGGSTEGFTKVIENAAHAGQGSLSITYVNPNGAGKRIYIASVYCKTLNVPGTQSDIRVTVQSLSSAVSFLNLEPYVSVTPGNVAISAPHVNADKSLVTADEISVIVGQTITVTVTVVDDYGNPVAGMDVYFPDMEKNEKDVRPVIADPDPTDTGIILKTDGNGRVQTTITCDFPYEGQLKPYVKDNKGNVTELKFITLSFVPFTPDIVFTEPQTEAVTGDYEVKIGVNDIILTADIEVWLHYWKPGEAEKTVQMFLSGEKKSKMAESSIYKATIPTGGNAGIRYYITVHNPQSEVSFSDTLSIMVKEDSFSVNNTKDTAHPDGIVNNRWTLFSVPAIFDRNDSIVHLLEPQLGLYGNTEPEHTWYYMTYGINGEKDSPSYFEPGKAYFLFQRVGTTPIKGGADVKNPITLNITQPGRTIIESDSVLVTLKNGWYLIGNPYPYAVPLFKLVRGENGVVIPDNIVTYEWNEQYTKAVNAQNESNAAQSGWSVPRKGTDALGNVKVKPWGGVLVHYLASTARNTNTMTVQKPVTIEDVLAEGWGSRISVYTGIYADMNNYIGVIPRESRSWDFFEPPSIGAIGSLYFEEENPGYGAMRYCTSFKEAGHEGYSWDMYYQSPGGKETITLAWNRINGMNEDIHYALVDISRGMVIGMDEDKMYEFRSFDKEYTYGFRVFAGSENYVNRNADELLASLPQTFALHQNYPNPFNPSTTIGFTLPVASPVSLNIYNMMGQKVKTLLDNSVLSPGTHEIRWDGRDDEENRVSSGIYIYSICMSDKIKAGKMVLIK
ncbi:PQQ-binding-like beta-propeller repeat protein [bacterium]|nr:PQQ-binding-like beta-propeller repeat protein [bacterium]